MTPRTRSGMIPDTSTLPPRIVPLGSASKPVTSTITAPEPVDGVQVATHFPEPAPDNTIAASPLENVARTAEPLPVSTGVPQLSAIAT